MANAPVTRRVSSEGERPFGYNVIGHLGSNLGLGVAARNVARLIAARGLPLAVLDVPIGDKRLIDAAERGEFDAHRVADFEALPYSINLFVVGFDRLRRMWDENPEQFRRDDVLNAAMSFWELPTLPPRWLPSLERLDVMVAASEFMRYAFQFSLSGPSTISARLPVDLPAGVGADRPRFDIPSETVAFVTSFDPYSDVERKNTAATIDAFVIGAQDRANAMLIVKVNNARDDNDVEHAAVGALRGRCAVDPRIRVMTEPLSYADVLSLYASADVYVSLHRAEGLGLGLAESMLLGKPVIATDWSGNLTFMDHGNACLVRTHLVRVEGSTHIYSGNHLEDTARWADPDVDHAAAWMRRLIDDATARTTIGEAAARRMADYNRDASEGAFLDELRSISEARRLLGLRAFAGTSRTDGSDAGRMGRLARIQQLERELDWIKSRPLYRVTEATKQALRAFRSTRRRQA